MTAYARAAPERRAYSNAMQRRQTAVASLLDAYESFVTANKGMSMASDYEPSLQNSGLLPDAVLTERCSKGLEFYQRLVTNVSKLLQRVKGVFNYCWFYNIQISLDHILLLISDESLN